LWRRLALPKLIENWSLTSLQHAAFTDYLDGQPSAIRGRERTAGLSLPKG